MDDETDEVKWTRIDPKPVDWGSFRAILDHVKEYSDRSDLILRDRIKALEDRIEPLLARITELEKAPHMAKFRGVWRSGHAYSAGDFTVHKGGLWHCSAPASDPTFVKPNSDEGRNVWTLCVKAGGVSGDSIA